MLLIGKSSPCGGRNSNGPTLLQHGVEVTAGVRVADVEGVAAEVAHDEVADRDGDLDRPQVHLRPVDGQLDVHALVIVDDEAADRRQPVEALQRPPRRPNRFAQRNHGAEPGDDYLRLCRIADQHRLHCKRVSL